MQTASVLVILVGALISSLTSCSHQNSSRRGAKHRDAILFEGATTAVQQKRVAVANLTLQTLVNTYPDSEYADRAKHMLQDSQIARCGEGFSNIFRSLCGPQAT